MVRCLLDAGAELEARAYNDWTCMHYVARNGYMETARLLLDRGADVTARSASDGETPLHLAVRNFHAEMVRLLLGRGTPPNVASKAMLTPLHFLAMVRSWSCCRIKTFSLRTLLIYIVV